MPSSVSTRLRKRSSRAEKHQVHYTDPADAERRAAYWKQIEECLWEIKLLPKGERLEVINGRGMNSYSISELATIVGRIRIKRRFCNGGGCYIEPHAVHR